MSQIARFISEMLSITGFFALLLTLSYFLYRSRCKRRFFKAAHHLYAEGYEVFNKFKKNLLADETSNAERFFANELKRKNLVFPPSCKTMTDRFVKIFIATVRKQFNSPQANSTENIEDRIRFEVINTLRGEFIEDAEKKVARHLMVLIPIFVALCTFFPLVFYFYLNEFLVFHPLTYFIAGIVFISASIWLFILARK